MTDSVLTAKTTYCCSACGELEQQQEQDGHDPWGEQQQQQKLCKYCQDAAAQCIFQIDEDENNNDDDRDVLYLTPQCDRSGITFQGGITSTTICCVACGQQQEDHRPRNAQQQQRVLLCKDCHDATQCITQIEDGDDDDDDNNNDDLSYQSLINNSNDNELFIGTNVSSHSSFPINKDDNGNRLITTPSSRNHHAHQFMHSNECYMNAIYPIAVTTPSSRTSVLLRNNNSVTVTPECKPSNAMIKRNSSVISVTSSTLSASSTVGSKTKLCIKCQNRTVLEDSYDYCIRCYSTEKRNNKKKKNEDDTITKSDENDKSKHSIQQFKNIRTSCTVTTTTTTTTGRCRLCTGAVLDVSYDYCLKCYNAKNRDDTKRKLLAIQEERNRKKQEQKTKKSIRIPYICVECGKTIDTDFSWKTMCPTCFRKSPKRPKLIKPAFVKTSSVSSRKRQFS